MGTALVVPFTHFLPICFINVLFEGQPEVVISVCCFFVYAIRKDFGGGALVPDKSGVANWLASLKDPGHGHLLTGLHGDRPLQEHGHEHHLEGGEVASLTHKFRPTTGGLNLDI